MEQMAIRDHRWWPGWYLVDDAKRTLWLKAASVGHPKATD